MYVYIYIKVWIKDECRLYIHNEILFGHKKNEILPSVTEWTLGVLH